ALDTAGTKAGNPQQHFAVGAVDVDRKAMALLERPGEFGIDGEVEQTPFPARHNFGHVEAIKADQPVGLIEAVLAHQGWWLERQARTGIGDGRKGRIVDPAQLIAAVKARSAVEDGAIVSRISTDDHLRRLAGRGKFG